MKLFLVLFFVLVASGREDERLDGWRRPCRKSKTKGMVGKEESKETTAEANMDRSVDRKQFTGNLLFRVWSKVDKKIKIKIESTMTFRRGTLLILIGIEHL